jgi:hypothetical protein
MCEGGRRCTAFGFFAKLQGLFDAKFDGALGRVLLHIKQLGTKNWEEFEPSALQKEEQKVQVFDRLAARRLLECSNQQRQQQLQLPCCTAGESLTRQIQHHADFDFNDQGQGSKRREDQPACSKTSLAHIVRGFAHWKSRASF